MRACSEFVTASFFLFFISSRSLWNVLAYTHKFIVIHFVIYSNELLLWPQHPTCNNDDEKRFFMQNLSIHQIDANEFFEICFCIMFYKMVWYLNEVTSASFLIIRLMRGERQMLFWRECFFMWIQLDKMCACMNFVIISPWVQQETPATFKWRTTACNFNSRHTIHSNSHWPKCKSTQT